MSERNELPVWLQRTIVAAVITVANVIGFFMRLYEGPPQPKGADHAQG